MQDCRQASVENLAKTVHNHSHFQPRCPILRPEYQPGPAGGQHGGGGTEGDAVLDPRGVHYQVFPEAMMDKPLSFYAFEVLYWCGIREGELLALTPADFDFEKRTSPWQVFTSFTGKWTVAVSKLGVKTHSHTRFET